MLIIIYIILLGNKYKLYINDYYMVYIFIINIYLFYKLLLFIIINIYFILLFYIILLLLISSWVNNN